MMQDNFNRPLLLINKKPLGKQMVSNGYYFYMIPDVVMKYANKVLKDTERRLYYAICGQAEKDQNGNNYNWAISHYCEIANIKSNHYSEVLAGLVKKGFIIHDKFKSIEVLYPISETEFIKANGEIGTSDRKNELNVRDSEFGKAQTTTNYNTTIPQIGKFDSDFSNRADKLGNDYSPICANNRDININKELRESISPQEEEYKKKVEKIIEKIVSLYDIEYKVNNQLNDLREQGFSYEFIFYALDNKRAEDFSMGIGLLFNNSYQKEINYKIQRVREEERKQNERLANIDLIEPKPPRIVRAQKRIMPEKELHPLSEFLEW